MSRQPGDPNRLSATRPKLMLWLVSGSIVFALSVFFAYELRSRHVAAISNAEHLSQSFADVLAEHTARTFEAVERTLQTAAAIRTEFLAGHTTIDAARQALKTLQKSSPALLAIGWSNESGDILVHSYPGDPVRASIAELPHFTEQRDNERRGLFIGPLIRSRLGQQWITTVSLRINHSDGRFAGVVSGPLNLSYFAKSYQSVKLGSHDAVVVVRSDGTILTREPFVENAVGRSFKDTNFFRDVSAGQQYGTFEAVSPVDGRARIFAYRVVEGLPLTTLVTQDRAEALAEWYSHARTFGPMVALLIVVILAGAAMLSRRTDQIVRGANLLTATLDNMDDGLLVVDQTDRIAVYNRRASQLLDIPESFLAARPGSKDVIAFQTERGEFANAPDTVKSRILPQPTGETANVYVRERPNGTVLEIRTVPFSSGGVVRTYKDVTQAKKFERELSKREEQFRLLAENASDMIVRVGVDAVIRYISPSCETITGFSVDEMLDQKITNFIHRDDLEATVRHFSQIIKSDPSGSARIVYRFRRKDGEWLWFESNPRILRSSPGVASEIFDVIRDMTERKEFEAQIEIARQKAEASAIAQAQFLATMSHELRTPLNSIIGFSDLVLDRNDLAPDARRQIGLIQTASETLLTVVNDVLDFSKIEEGKLELTSNDFEVREMIDAVAAIVRGSADARCLDLRVSVDESIGRRLIGDDQRIRQVLFNLLNNAIKFTAEGSVSFEVNRKGGDEDGDRLWIGITDTGIGIPEDKLDRLFQRFSQVDGSTSREYGGSGLGLAICKRLVEMMGGQIGVESKQNEGSTFWIELYLKRAAPEQLVPDARAPETIVRAAHLLLVEDVEVNREIASAFLRKLGYSVDAVSDGADAIVSVRSGVYDLVLIDIQMPGMDGITATKLIRSLPGKFSGIPIIAMTANVLPTQVEAFRLAGMDGHIGKPFKRTELRLEIERCLSNTAPRAPHAAPPALDTPVVDEQAIATLTGLLGTTKVNSLVLKLQQQLQSFVASDTELATASDLAGQAHRLVSSAGMLGFRAASEHCARLEVALREQKPTGAGFEQARLACIATIDEISKRFDTTVNQRARLHG